MFEPGAMHVVGPDNLDDATLATYLVMNDLRKVNVFPFLHATRVCNVVCSASMGHWINIEGIAAKYQWRCTLSEVFEGLHFTWKTDYSRGPGKKPKVTMVIIFDTGRVVITGGTTFEEIQSHFKGIIPILRQFKVDRKPISTFKRKLKAKAKAAAAAAAADRDSCTVGEPDMEHELIGELGLMHVSGLKRPLLDSAQKSAPRAKRHKPTFGYET
jgi:TATA-box binding protein (TBP) (component of TFIID and TFIIIB)